MPASIPYSSQLPKFPDGKRRPGLIQLAKPLSTPPRSSIKLPGLNSPQKSAQFSDTKIPGIIAISSYQLMTPAPSPRRQQNQNRRRQKRSSIGNINNIVVVNTQEDSSGLLLTPPLDTSPTADVSTKPSAVLISSPPTQAARKSQKKAKPAPPVLIKAAAKGRRSTALVSPPTTPGAHAVKFTPNEGAVFPVLDGIVPLLPPVTLTQDLKQARASDDSLPLADDDEIIVWKQPVTAQAFTTSPAPPVVPRTPSPKFATWEDLNTLPRLSPATVARLKEEYDIRPSKAFQRAQTMTQEPDLLNTLLKGSSSAPSTPGVPVFSASSPIPIKRPTRHGRTPSVPLFPAFTRAAEYRADVADIFGLDIRDEFAVDKAAEAWKAYAGSAFNVSPPDGEQAVAPKPKFLGMLFD